MNLCYIFDIDGVLLNPGTYFSKNPYPKGTRRGQKRYDDWLEKVEVYLNKHGYPNPGMASFVATLQNDADVYYLTSKQEHLRTSTLAWLDAHGFPTDFIPLLMRPKGENRSYGAFKTAVLKQLEKEHGVIIMFDDDPKELLQKEFKKHKNWMLFKCVTGGELL